MRNRIDFILRNWRMRSPALADERDVVRYVANAVCERTAQLTCRYFAGRRDCLLSGNGTELRNLWEEYCVQVQSQESYLWDAYEESLVQFVTLAIGELEDYERLAIWLQTLDGLSWSADESNCQHAPVADEALVQYVLQEYVYRLAAEYENQRIRRFIARSSTRD